MLPASPLPLRPVAVVAEHLAVLQRRLPALAPRCHVIALRPNPGATVEQAREALVDVAARPANRKRESFGKRLCRQTVIAMGITVTQTKTKTFPVNVSLRKEYLTGRPK